MSLMQTRCLCYFLALTLKDFSGFPRICLFFSQNSSDNSKAPLSTISYQVTGSFSRSRLGLESVMRPSTLHDNLVLQLSYLLFICSAAGHQWLAMPPGSVERNKKILFCRLLISSSVCFSQAPAELWHHWIPWRNYRHSQKQSWNCSPDWPELTVLLQTSHFSTALEIW